MGNTGPMEWVIFQSKTSFDVNDQRENGKEPIVGTVKIRLKTGPQAIKCFMGYGWCSLNKGFDVGGDDGKGSNRRYKENEKSKVLTVRAATCRCSTTRWRAWYRPSRRYSATATSSR